MAHHGGPTTRPTSGPTTPTRRGEGRRACRARSSGMSGPIVGHVGPDRRACRARSSGMSGPIVGHVGPDFGRVVGCRKLPFSASIRRCCTSVSFSATAAVCFCSSIVIRSRARSVTLSRSVVSPVARSCLLTGAVKAGFLLLPPN